jgi:hypothetical protein
MRGVAPRASAPGSFSQGKVNIFNLAKNAGTSVNQIERFYARYLPLSRGWRRTCRAPGSAADGRHEVGNLVTGCFGFMRTFNGFQLALRPAHTGKEFRFHDNGV